MGIFGNILAAAPGVAARGFQGASAGRQIRSDREAREAEAEERKQRALREEQFRQGVQAWREAQAEREHEQRTAPKPPKFSASAGGVSSTFETEEDARDFADRNRPDPAEASLTPGQRLTQEHRQSEQVEEEALGNALTWAGSGQIERDRGIQLIARQHKLPVGRASTIWDNAVQRLTMQEGRELTNEGKREDDGGPAEMPPGLAEDLDAALQTQSPEEILREMERDGVDPGLRLQAQAYMRQRGG